MSERIIFSFPDLVHHAVLQWSLNFPDEAVLMRAARRDFGETIKIYYKTQDKELHFHLIFLGGDEKVSEVSEQIEDYVLPLFKPVTLPGWNGVAINSKYNSANIKLTDNSVTFKHKSSFQHITSFSHNCFYNEKYSMTYVVECLDNLYTFMEAQLRAFKNPPNMKFLPPIYRCL